MFKGKEAKVRIVAEIHMEDDLKEVVLNMYTHGELVEKIDEEMMKKLIARQRVGAATALFLFL